MMKLILIGLTVLPTVALASSITPPCKAKAVRAAMRSYLSIGVIQGDSPIPSYKLTSIKDGIAKHLIIISGGNDDGESWDVPFKVATDVNNDCKVLSVKKARKYEIHNYSIELFCFHRFCASGNWTSCI